MALTEIQWSKILVQKLRKLDGRYKWYRVAGGQQVAGKIVQHNGMPDFFVTGPCVIAGQNNFGRRYDKEPRYITTNSNVFWIEFKGLKTQVTAIQCDFAARCNVKEPRSFIIRLTDWDKMQFDIGVITRSSGTHNTASFWYNDYGNYHITMLYQVIDNLIGRTFHDYENYPKVSGI